MSTLLAKLIKHELSQVPVGIEPGSFDHSVWKQETLDRVHLDFQRTYGLDRWCREVIQDGGHYMQLNITTAAEVQRNLLIQLMRAAQLI